MKKINLIIFALCFLFLGMIIGYSLFFFQMKSFFFDFLQYNDIKLNPILLDEITREALVRFGL